MINEPKKYQFEEENKNFCFRPQSPTYKQNIKLKPFVTDKVRIEKYLKLKQKENEIINKNKRKNKNDNLDTFSENDDENAKTQYIFVNKNSDKNEMDNYLQPIMKFKPRTDLERIFDAVNLNYFGKVDKNLINEQLKSLGLIKVYNKKSPNNQDNEYSLLREKLKVNPETLEYLIKEKQRLEQGPKTKEIYELIHNMDNIIQINKEIKSEQINKGISLLNKRQSRKLNKFKNKRKNLNNFLAKNILGEYQKKTHFKALCTYTLDLEDINTKNKKLERFHSLDNLDYNNDHFDINNYQKKFKSNNNYEPNKLTYLKNLFLKKEKKPIIPIPEKDKKSFEYEEDTNKFIRQQNNVIINGKYYNKKDLKGISNALLKKCNYISKHFDSENAGEGKLMFTRGMTVNEFSKKYGLPK